jgi:hypothetical protein
VRVSAKPGPNLPILLAVVILCLLWLAGCGEDDKKTTGSGGNAPGSLTGQTYDLTSADTTSIAFASSGSTYILTQPGSRTDTGVYTATRSGDTWDVRLTSSTSGTLQSQLLMTFSGNGVGTFSFTEAGSNNPVSGQFQRSASTASAPKASETLARKRLARKGGLNTQNTMFLTAPQGSLGNFETGTPVGAFALAVAV